MFLDNALYILFPVLSLITCLAYLLTRFDIMHPFSIVSSVMTLSVFLSITEIRRWNLHMDITAAIIVVTSILFFGAGCVWTDGVTRKKIPCPYTLSTGVNSFYIKNSWLAFFLCIILFFTFLQFREIRELSVQLGNTEGYSNMIRIVRAAIEKEQVRLSRWNAYENIVIAALLYSSIAVALSNLFNNRYVGNLKERIKSSIKYFIIVPFCIPSFILSTGREPFLELFLFIAVAGSIIYQKNNGFSLTSTRNIFKYSIILGILFFAFFLILGYFTGKMMRPGYGPLEILAHYAGISMPAFSHFIMNYTFPETPYIGGTTLTGIYSNLISLGMQLPRPPVFLDMVMFYAPDHGNSGCFLYSLLQLRTVLCKVFLDRSFLFGADDAAIFFYERRPLFICHFKYQNCLSDDCYLCSLQAVREKDTGIKE